MQEQTDALELKVKQYDAASQKAVADKIGRVRAILQSVEADGSWGVHNLKYTESLLLNAQKLLNEIETGN